MTKKSVKKLCALSAVLVSVQVGSVLNSNSYNASAMMGNRFRSILSSIRGALNRVGNAFTNFSSTLRRGSTPIRSTEDSPLSQNRSAQGELNSNLRLSKSSALIQTPDPRHSQIKSIPGHGQIKSIPVKNIDIDRVKIVTYNSDGNYFYEAVKDGKVIIKKVRNSNGTMVTEWLSKDSDTVEKREFKTPNKIITIRFLEDGSSDVDVKDIKKGNK